jgi:hypothetical protein
MAWDDVAASVVAHHWESDRGPKEDCCKRRIPRRDADPSELVDYVDAFTDKAEAIAEMKAT